MICLTLIEYCDANEANHPLINKLEERNGVSVLETQCMSECELCACEPYVFFNGELLSAESLVELVQLIEQRLVESYDENSTQ